MDFIRLLYKSLKNLKIKFKNKKVFFFFFCRVKGGRSFFFFAQAYTYIGKEKLV